MKSQTATQNQIFEEGIVCGGHTTILRTTTRIVQLPSYTAAIDRFNPIRLSLRQLTGGRQSLWKTLASRHCPLTSLPSLGYPLKDVKSPDSLIGSNTLRQ